MVSSIGIAALVGGAVLIAIALIRSLRSPEYGAGEKVVGALSGLGLLGAFAYAYYSGTPTLKRADDRVRKHTTVEQCIREFHADDGPDWRNRPLVTIKTVNMRGGPGTSFRIIKSLTGGTSVRYLKVEGLWLSVTDGSAAGWIHAGLVRLADDKEVLPIYRRTIQLGVHYAIPEGSWLSKLLGVFIGLVISLLTSVLFGKSKGVFLISTVITFLYYVIKNSIQTRPFSGWEIAVFSMTVTLLALVQAGICDWIIGRLQDR